MYFVVSAGGTAGHINPAIAVADELARRGHDILFVGTPDHIEAKLATQAGFEFMGLSVAGFDKAKPWTLISSSIKILKASNQCKAAFKKRRPDAVLGFGAYVSIPVGRAASSMGIPLIIHEQNSVPGMANKYLAKRADVTAQTYPESAQFLQPKGEAPVIGNPVRASFEEADGAAGRALCSIPEDALVLLVFGGSLGAQHLNRAICALKDRLLAIDNLHVIHGSGSRDFEEVTATLALTDEEAQRWHLFEYIDQMGDILAASDLVVSRAGASSLAEIMTLGVPAVLVPFPYARGDHQTLNASSCVSAGAAKLVPDSEVESEEFAQLVIGLLNDSEQRARMREAAAGMSGSAARTQLADIAISYASGGQTMNETSHIHFIGIGGVGMSGIARVAHRRGMVVTGSDMKESKATLALKREGIKVFIGHDAANLADDLDAVVISTAIPERNPELAYARAHGIPVWHRSHMLAHLGEGLKTLACAGTHGKTTTSSMLATTVDRMGLDPTFLIGGTVDGYDTNARCGTGEYYIVEADESDGSFVHLSPYAALITNVEADHLDHYGTLEAIYEAFEDFLRLIPDEGAAVVCAENARLVSMAKSTGRRVVTYGEAGTEGAEATFVVKRRSGIGNVFEITFPDGTIVDASLPRSPGRHNVLNATGVLTLVWAIGLDVEEAARALSTFSGVRRRFDLVGEAAGVTVVDDYAHHPTEIKATLSAASKLDFNHVHVLFQPHRYSRTEALAAMFSDAFDDADSVTLMDVYPAGEAPIPGISGKTVVESVLSHEPRHQCAWLPHRPEVVPYLTGKLKPGDLIITMGAGDVTSMGRELLEALGRKA